MKKARMKSRKKKLVDEIVTEAIRTQKRIDELKELYAELDGHIESLVTLGFKGDDRVAIVDNFENVHAVFRTTSVKRYSLVVL